MIIEWNGSVYGSPQVIDWSGGQGRVIGGTVCGVVTLTPRVDGAVAVLARVDGTVALTPRVDGAVRLEEC